MNPSKFLILFSLFLFTSCAMFERRQFIDEMEYQFDQPMFAAHDDFMVVAGDTGRDHRTKSEILNRTPASAQTAEDMRYSASLARELQFLESKLSNQDYEEYLQYKSELGNSSQQIYFLRLSAAERASYLGARGLGSTNRRDSLYSAQGRNQYQRRVAGSAAMRQIPNINDIILGMTKDDVVQNWGQPERMDVAGDPRYENERWAYRVQGGVKYIYFESGRVEGWTEQ